MRVGLVSVDGSKFKANASKHRSVTYERAGGLIAQLEGEIAALLSRAEAADVAGEEDPQALPKEIARRAALRDAARRHLEARAAARTLATASSTACRNISCLSIFRYFGIRAPMSPCRL